MVYLTIEDKVNSLPSEQRRTFENQLYEMLNGSGTWCEMNGIDYANPNPSEAREKLYMEWQEKGLINS